MNTNAPSHTLLTRRLDQVRGRIRLLRSTAGLCRVAARLAATLATLYLADRWLNLPVPVRGALLVLVALLLLRELWRHLGRPLLRGPDRLDTARLVERALPQAEGRIISALQVESGAEGTLASRLHGEAAELCRTHDLRQVLRSRPALRTSALSCGVLLLIAALVGLTRPPLDVFARRWALQDVAWPRDTRLFLELEPAGPSHRVLEDGDVLVARGGLLEVGARVEGRTPNRVEVVVDGAQGERSAMLSVAADGTWRGRLPIERGDTVLWVRGGDDTGADTELRLQVVEPPRLLQPRFFAEPPAYLGQAPRELTAADLMLDEGTRLRLSGEVPDSVHSGLLRLLSSGQELPLRMTEGDGGRLATVEFVAEASDTLVVVLVGEAGLETPDPDHLPLMVRKDRAPTLRVFAPARSDLKVTARAVVPFAALAEDDHGIASVRLHTQQLSSGGAVATAPTETVLDLVADETRPAQRRHLLDLSTQSQSGALSYRLEAQDGRDLPGRGPQLATADGRRLEVVDDAEVQRLLADRQLRVKEAFAAIRERQRTAAESVAELVAVPPPADDPELLGAVVAQQQVTARLTREARELCSVLDELLLNRLDAAPGAASVLARRLADWQAAPVDEGFAPQAWRTLAAEHTAGAFGRLDLVGRLLDMVGVALMLEQDLSPAAHKFLESALTEPSSETLAAAQEAQLAVLAGLESLLGRMEEWEDYQEVLLVVKTLIDEQQALRERTQAALTGARGPN
ncbi:MAG: hypothetical protein ACT4PU_00795 [Planctomycetota bacterium]